MNWIRIATKMKGDPRIGAIATLCKIRVHEAVGLVCCALMEFPDHAHNGDISAVPDVIVEQWALWSGRPGVFAEAFRAQLCDEAGVVRAWDRHNGAALRKAKSDIERKRAHVNAKNGERSAPNRRAENTRAARGRRAEAAESPSDFRAVSEVDETRRKETTASAAAAAVVSAASAARPDDANAENDAPWADLRGALLARFADPVHRDAVSGYLRSSAFPPQVAGHIAAAIDRDGADPQHVGAALADMRVNGVSVFHAATFAGYVHRAKAGPRPKAADGTEPTWDAVIAREEAATHGA
jgi:hypothetical protein